MKKLVIMSVLLASGMMFAQEIEPKFEVVDQMVKATYYHDNGQIKEQGQVKYNKALFDYERSGIWKKFDKNPVRLINEFSEAQQYHFDLDGSGIFWTQIIENAEKKIDTWAIFWYATIYQNHGLCLNPSLTYADNIGIDGSGTHSGNSYSIERRKLNHSIEVNLDVKIQESSYAVEEIRVYYKSKERPVLARFINRLSRVILKKNIL